MENVKKTEPQGLTRREVLKVSGLALGGLGIGGGSIGPEMRKALTDQSCVCPPGPSCTWITPYNPFDPNLPSQMYSYFDTLPPFNPYAWTESEKTTIAPLLEDEMRITFMGSTVPPGKRAQQTMSIFVEVGWNRDKQMPLDQFIFDMGSGVCTNYAAMNVGFGRMDKVFIAHLHGDHMSDVLYNYCFGPSGDRKSPLYVWGQSPSRVKSPAGIQPFTMLARTPPSRLYDDGVKAFCQNLREACRWHSESFSFQTTSYSGYPSQTKIQNDWGLPCKPVPVSDDPWGDAYAMVPIELDWTKVGGVAYQNANSRVRITHFPVIHCRKGSMGYKLEWWPKKADLWNPAKALSMIYTSDTKPETNCVNQAKVVDPATRGVKGVDVFIHEMAVPPNVWGMKFNDIKMPGGQPEQPPDSSDPAVHQSEMVQNSSHTPPGPFGYILSQIPRPRLAVATHFPTSDDTTACAMEIVQEHFPKSTVYQGNNVPSGANDPVRITWSFDLMVISVTKDQIVEQKGVVSDFLYSPAINLPPTTNLSPATPNTPKYHDADGNGDPYAQIDTSTAIDPCKNGNCNYREDGY